MLKNMNPAVERTNYYEENLPAINDAVEFTVQHRNTPEGQKIKQILNTQTDTSATRVAASMTDWYLERCVKWMWLTGREQLSEVDFSMR